MFTPHLNMDRVYSVFGRVIAGMNYVDTIERGEPPLQPTRIVRASLGSDNLPEMSAAELQAAGARLAAAARRRARGDPAPRRGPGPRCRRRRRRRARSSRCARKARRPPRIGRRVLRSKASIAGRSLRL